MKTIVTLVCLILLSGCTDYEINVNVLAPDEEQGQSNVYIILIGNTDDDSLPFDIKASGIPRK